MKIELIPELRSDTLLLRPWRKEFAQDFLRVNSDPGTAEACCVKPIATLSDAKAKLRAFEKSRRMEWSIALLDGEDSLIVGGIGLCEVISIKEYRNVKELGYGMAEQYRGRGIMPAAVKLVEDYCFTVLDSEAVIIRINSGNSSSQRVAEKCGYVYHSKLKLGDGYKTTYIKVRDK